MYIPNIREPSGIKFSWAQCGPLHRKEQSANTPHPSRQSVERFCSLIEHRRMGTLPCVPSRIISRNAITCLLASLLKRQSVAMSSSVLSVCSFLDELPQEHRRCPPVTASRLPPRVQFIILVVCRAQNMLSLCAILPFPFPSFSGHPVFTFPFHIDGSAKHASASWEPHHML